MFQKRPSCKAPIASDIFETLSQNITNIDGCTPASIHNHITTAFGGIKEYVIDLDISIDTRLIMIFLIKLLGISILELILAGGMQP